MTPYHVALVDSTGCMSMQVYVEATAFAAAKRALVDSGIEYTEQRMLAAKEWMNKHALYEREHSELQVLCSFVGNKGWQIAVYCGTAKVMECCREAYACPTDDED